MSKKDQLGRGSSFGMAAGALSARRGAIEQTIHGGSASPAAVTDLPVPVISDNPDNPRNHLRNLDYTVESVREVGVILPIVVATVDAYLRSRPDRAEDLDDGAQYVVVDGHRRLEAARRAGLATIPVRVDDAYVTTDEKLLEAAFVANYHRDDMTDLEEAHALKQLVDYYGSQTKAAKRLGIPQNTISSKLSLLKLSPELQKDLQTGERKVEHVRNLGKLSAGDQKAKADERAESARQRAEVRKDRSTAPPEETADYHAVISHEPAAPEPEPVEPVPAQQAYAAAYASAEPAAEARPAQKAVERPESIPEPREAVPAGEPAGGRPPKPFPYENGGEALLLLLHKMPPTERFKVFAGLGKDPETQAANVG